MGNKGRNTNYDILDKVLSDDKQAQRIRDAHRGAGYDDKADGTWITSKEQFDQLYNSTNDLEKYLRS